VRPHSSNPGHAVILTKSDGRKKKLIWSKLERKGVSSRRDKEKAFRGKKKSDFPLGFGAQKA